MELQRLIFSIRDDAPISGTSSPSSRPATVLAWFSRIRVALLDEVSQGHEDTGDHQQAMASELASPPAEASAGVAEPLTGRHHHLMLPCSNPSASVLSALLDVQQAEMVSMRFSERVNRSYARLGEAYIAFGRASFDLSQVPQACVRSASDCAAGTASGADHHRGRPQKAAGASAEVLARCRLAGGGSPSGHCRGVCLPSRQAHFLFLEQGCTSSGERQPFSFLRVPETIVVLIAR